MLQTNKKKTPNLYYLYARGEQTLFPKPLFLARTFNFTRSQHRPNTLDTPKLKGVCQRQFTEV